MANSLDRNTVTLSPVHDRICRFNQPSFEKVYLSAINAVMKKVFLGGTCNGSQWRRRVIKDLKLHYYDPMRDEWTPEMMQEELKQRSESDFCLYVITPKMDGFFSVAEVIDDSNKRPGKTIFTFLYEDDGQRFSDVQIKSLQQVGEMVKRNGANYLTSLDEVITFLNNQ